MRHLCEQCFSSSVLKSRINEPLPDYHSIHRSSLLQSTRESRHDRRFARCWRKHQRAFRWWAGGFGVLILRPELAEYLISRGATVDIHSAARLGMIDRVRELLAPDPQLVHARGGDGQLPLHFAATAEIAALLFVHGAEIDARDIDHESTAAQYMVFPAVYELAKQSYRHDVARFLIFRGAQTDILMASAVGDLALVERILNDEPEPFALRSVNVLSQARSKIGWQHFI